MRKSFSDHLYSFRRYDREDTFYYFNIMRGRYPESYRFIREGMFDAIIFHNSALILRGSHKYWKIFTENILPVCRDSSCIKVALVQDDYTLTGYLRRFICDINMDLVYSILREENQRLVYPEEEMGDIPVRMVYTGYVDENTMRRLKDIPHRQRPLDMVYRAKKLPYSYGKLGYNKYAIIEEMEKALGKFPELKTDLGSTTNKDNVITGEDWMDFLQSSRTVLGTLSGAGIIDMEGVLRERTEQYCKNHPGTTYEEAKRYCFPEAEENIKGMLSPRHFEAAMTGTCQVLLGYDYQGVLVPDVDYIPIAEDYSNLDEVLEKIKDISYCERIARQCYKDVVLCGRYTYQRFVDEVMGDIRLLRNEKAKTGEVKGQSLLTPLYAYWGCRKNNRAIHRDLIRMEKENNRKP